MKNIYIEKNVDGYHVELEVNYDDEDVQSDCWIEKDGHSASLLYMIDQGSLHDSNFNYDREVPQRTIKKITKWAEANGY